MGMGPYAPGIRQGLPQVRQQTNVAEKGAQHSRQETGCAVLEELPKD
jgi:hypothetical protein